MEGAHRAGARPGHDRYREYIFKARDGVLARKRTLDAVMQEEGEVRSQEEMAAVVKRIKGNPDLWLPFVQFPLVEEWRVEFLQDALRYRILIILSYSKCGKTEFAKNLWPTPLVLRIGSSEHWPDTLRKFERGRHTHIVLDDVRDMTWVARAQDKVQGVWDEELEFGTTQGGTCAYTKYLFQVPIVVTANMSTEHLEYLESPEAHDFLGREENRAVLRLTQRRA